MEFKKLEFIEDIEPGKTWNEYTDEEKAILPKLTPEQIGDGKNVPYAWIGFMWEYIQRD